MVKSLLHSFLAFAYGDAIGYPFEFVSPGNREVLQSIAGNSPLVVSDDTQMSLFTMQALCEVYANGNRPNAHKIAEVVCKHYKEWYRTQCGQSRRNVTVLGTHPLMCVSRAPGNACLRGMHALTNNTQPPAGLYTANGCGTVMRLMPFAMLEAAGEDSALVQDAALLSAWLTHRGSEIPRSNIDLLGYYRQAFRGDLRRPFQMRASSQITDYGQGWTSKSCVDMSVFAATTEPTLEAVLTTATAHPGDSDSVAAIAASLFCAQTGEAVPQAQLERLVEYPLILSQLGEFLKVLETLNGHQETQSP